LTKSAFCEQGWVPGALPEKKPKKPTFLARAADPWRERGEEKSKQFSLFLNLYLTPGNKTPTGKTLGPLGGLDGLRAWEEVVH
jgi:hypothetical protein